MPVQQIAVSPIQETAGKDKSAAGPENKNEGQKSPGRSRSKSTNISKASSSTTGLGTATAARTSANPSSQDICSSDPVTRLEQDSSDGHSHKHVAEPAVSSKAPGSSQILKKQTKRRHRRKSNVGPPPPDRSPSTDRSASTDRSERGKKREGGSKPRREHSHHRSSAPPRSGSSSEGEEGCGGRRVRSWSKEKARRGRRRSGSGRERDGVSGAPRGGDGVEDLELLSVGSEEGQEDREDESQEDREDEGPEDRDDEGQEDRDDEGPEDRDDEGPEDRDDEGPEDRDDEGPEDRDDEGPEDRDDEGQEDRDDEGPEDRDDEGPEDRDDEGPEEGGSPARRDGQESQRTGSECGEREAHYSPRSSTPPQEEGEEPITTCYQERGTDGGDTSIPTSQRDCGVGGSAQPCSDDETEVCRICHCEGEEEYPLIAPCRCTGTLGFVHMACLNQWIKSSDTRCCELCKYNFIMVTRLKPLRKWEKLQMPSGEGRKIFCSVVFHLLAVLCVLWSVCVLVKRTAEEINLGVNNDDLWRVSLVKYHIPDGVLEWPFWTKLTVVAMGFASGLIFLYIQCKVYLQLWRRLQAFNRIITVHNCAEKAPPPPQAPPPAAALANGKNETTVEVPMGHISNPAPEPQMDSDPTVEAAVAPAESPV